MALASGFPCAVLFVAFLYEINFVRATSPPTHILCVDKDCQGKLGEGVTLQAYAPIVDEFINFGKNEKVTVFGRTEKSGVLHVQVGDKRGYAPENVIKIEKMFVAKEQLVEVEVLSIQASKAASDEATQATELPTEPVPTEATPSPAVVKKCRIHGTVMSGFVCDDDEAELIDEIDAVTQLENSVDNLATSSLDSWSSSFTTDVKLDLSLEAGSSKASEEPVTAGATELPALSHTQVDDADPEKEKAASSEQPLSTSLVKDAPDEVSVEEEGEDERDGAEEKPIPGEVDEEADESLSEDNDARESNTAPTGAVSSLAPSEMGLGASSSDTAVLSGLATPSLPLQQPDSATTDQLLSSTALPQQSSTPASEALLPSETDLSASLVDKSAVLPSLDTPSADPQQPSLLTASYDLYFSQLYDEPSSSATATSLPVGTGSDTSSSEEPAVTPSSIAPLSDQSHTKPPTSEDVDTPSSLLSEQLAPFTAASSTPRQTEPVESSIQKLSSSDATVPLREPHLTEQTSSVDDPSPILSSESKGTSILEVPALQSVETGLSSSAVAEPAPSELPMPSREQQMQDVSSPEPFSSQPLAPSEHVSVGTSLPLSNEGSEGSSFIEPVEPILATASLGQQRADLTTPEDLLTMTPLTPEPEQSSAESAAFLMPSASPASEPSVEVELGSTATFQAESMPPEPTAEALVSPSLLPADGLATSPVPAKTEPSQEQPSGGAMDWDVIEEYIWQMLALFPEPLRAALARPMLPSSSPLLLACCALLVTSLAISLRAAWLHHRKASSLAGNMSILEQRLFTLETERQVLSEQLAQTKAQADRGGRTLSQHERELDTLREEVQNQEEELQQLRTRLSEQTQKLEANQVALAVAQKTLLEREAEASERSAALASLERQLSEVCAERDLWREQATESQAQERSLQQSLSDATDTSDRLWSELEALKHRQETLCEEVSASNQEATEMAEKLQQKDARIQVLELSLAQLEVLQKHRTTSQGEAETEADEEGAMKARLQELLDAAQARHERDQVEERRQQLQVQLNELQEQLHTQQVRVESLEKELEKSAAAKAEAERHSTEAQTKLDVLSNYFKDRELQLQKEVGTQEVERRLRETEASTATQQLTLLEQQCQSYRSQLSSLRQEMELSERNYKNQVADQEKRAHENWLAARAAERKLEEANRDRTALRQRLTLLERELQQQPPPLPPGDLFPPRLPLLNKDEAPLLDGPPHMPPLDMMPPPPFPPFPPPPPPELLKHMRATGGSPHFFDLAPPPPPFMPRPGRSSQASVSSSASDSRGRPLKSSPQPLSADSRRNGTGGRSTPL